MIWPAHGLALGMLLVAPVRRWPVYLALVVVATLAVGFDLHARLAAHSRQAVAVNVALPLVVADRAAAPRRAAT